MTALHTIQVEVVNIGSTSVKTRHFIYDYVGNHIQQQLVDGIIKDCDVDILVYRLVHFGNVFYGRPWITLDQVTHDVQENLNKWAPIHNPRVFTHARQRLKDTRAYSVIFVSDSYFHLSIPMASGTLPLPKRARDAGARVYGFHGFAYMNVLVQYKTIVDNDRPNLICIHLGGGCSACCIENGVSIDTTMTITPNSGLIMPTRCGNVDISVCDLFDLDTRALSHDSGLLGICGTSHLGDIMSGATSDQNEDMILARDMFVQRIVDAIAVYYVRLNGSVDGIVFSGGISEHVPEIVQLVCCRLSCIGVTYDGDSDCEFSRGMCFKHTSSSIPIAIVGINEEIEMMKLARSCISQMTIT